MKNKNKNKLIIVAYINNNPAGYIIGYAKYEDTSFYCWMAAVDPKYRKLGILTKLMKHQNKWAKKNNYKSIKIKTRNNQREMLSYLVKNNFQFLKITPQTETKDNRILLEKQL